MCRIEITREKAIITEMYKCLNGLGPQYMSEIFQQTNAVSRRGPSFNVPRVNSTTKGLHSLRYQGPRLWNALPLNVKSSKTLNSLKNNLNAYKGAPCKCAACKKL